MYFSPVVEVAQAETIVIEEKPQEVLIEVVYNWSEERINKEVEDKAKEYKVSADLMKAIINCESQGSTTIQSNHRYHAGNVPKGYKIGDREMSFGLSQIHLPAHHVTKEEAIDPKFAIDFMAKNISEGHANWWSCYKMI